LSLGHLFPQTVPALNKQLTSLNSKVGVKQIVCGMAHTAILTHTGQVYTIGRGLEGQCGLPLKNIVDEPVLVLRLPPGIVQIAAGHTYTLALCDNGKCYVMGSGLKGAVNWGGILTSQRANEADWFLHTPREIELDKVASIEAAGPYHAILRCSNGLFFGVGSNQDQQLPMVAEAEGQMANDSTTDTHAFLLDFGIQPECLIIGASWSSTAVLECTVNMQQPVKQ